MSNNRDVAAPAFSFGKLQRSSERRQDRDFKQIGPGSYQVSLVDKKKEPAFSMGQKIEDLKSKLNVPGAGTYETSPDIAKEKMGKTMGSKLRLKTLKGELGPGPGGYDADKLKKKNLAYTMGSKLKDIEFDKKNFQPGPGNYDSQHSAVKNRNPTVRFGTSKRPDLAGGKESSCKPAPNTYSADPQKVKTKAPQYRFGTEARNSLDMQSMKHRVPGPGEYMARTFTGHEGSKFSMGQTIQYEPHRKEGLVKPGPGTYSPDERATKQREATWKIGTSSRQDLLFEKKKQFQTSPGQYDPDFKKVKNQAAGWKIGSEQRPGLVKKGHDKFPGAGQYEYYSTISSGPKILMHSKLDKVDQNVKKGVPGPDRYDLQNSPNMRQSTGPAFSVGKSVRQPVGGKKTSLESPSPDRYNHLGACLNSMKSAPIFSFGKENRPELGRKKHQLSPGPGQYQEKAVIGHDGPSLTMSPKYGDKFKEKKDKLVPGPGKYEFSLKTKKTAPMFGMGTSKRQDPSASQITKDVTTEPAGYNPDYNANKIAAPKFRFGTQPRSSEKDIVNSPAPGYYTIKNGAIGNRGIIMGQKLKNLSSMKTPGSGTYNPNIEFSKTSYPKFSMGAKLKYSSTSTLVTPGPDTYLNATEKLKISAPKFGFGSSKRPEIGGSTKNMGPGPGSYKVPTKIQNLPDFAMPGRSQDFKFV